MKVRYYLFQLFILLSICFSSNDSYASHALGGELSWECDGNGNYIFYAKVYRDCTGIPYNYTNLTMDIVGSPLPRNAPNGSVISSIVLRPDSNRWRQRNQGDITPVVDPSKCAVAAWQIDCSSGDPGAIQELPYKSDPIALFGQPPSTGWTFGLLQPCCRPIVTNLAGGGTMLISAKLYPDPQAPLNGGCYESSPQFIDSPDYLYCRGEEAVLSFGAIDSNGDSLVYRWSRTMNAPVTAPSPVPFAPGYSMFSPTPGPAFDSLNQAAILDPAKGLVSFLINNGSPSILYYQLTVEVDAYRNSNLVSTIKRDFSVEIFDCQAFPSSARNKIPQINPPFYKGGTTFSFDDSITVGNLMTVNLSVLDTNIYMGNPQNLRIEVKGSSMALDLRTDTLCPFPNDSNCAFISRVPAYDTARSVYYYGRAGSWNAQMRWQTDCGDLNVDGSAKTHYFYLRANDRHCPIPGINTKTIAITVLPDPNNCQGLATNAAEHLSLEQEVSIYPNPTNGLVFIEGKTEQNFRYQLFNLQGKLIQDGQLPSSQQQLELPSQSGVYFIKLMDAEGNVGHFKVVKQ